MWMAVLGACWIDFSELDDATGAQCADGSPAVSWYRDPDGDGYGDDVQAVLSCDPPVGFSPAGGDCDETDANVNPGAPESCNGLDDDCDYQVDEGGESWCNDVDLDGHGDPGDVIHACDQPSGYVETCDDCDDRDSGVRGGC